ncbi:MAG: hypothetical protein ABI658_14885 [Acidimicrobiales bacterium]
MDHTTDDVPGGEQTRSRWTTRERKPMPRTTDQSNAVEQAKFDRFWAHYEARWNAPRCCCDRRPA